MINTYRTREFDGTYGVNTVTSSVKVLKAFGRDAIQEVFGNSEVLSCRTVFGESVSLTHEEWDILWPELSHFSESFASCMLDRSLQSSEIDFLAEDIILLVSKLLEIHPLQGNSRVCNKLLSFLSTLDDIKVLSHISLLAQSLYSRIVNSTLPIYKKHIESVDINYLAHKIDLLSEKLSNSQVDQLTVSHLPKWYNTSQQYVDKQSLLKLLYTNKDWTKADSSGREERSVQEFQAVEHIFPFLISIQFYCTFVLCNYFLMWLYLHPHMTISWQLAT